MGKIVGKVFGVKEVKDETLGIDETNELIAKDLKGLNMDQLRIVAEAKGIEVNSKLKKDELISLITESKEEEGE